MSTNDFLTITLRPKGRSIKGLPKHLNVSHNSTVGDLYSQLASTLKCSIHRLRIANSDKTATYLSSLSKESISISTIAASDSAQESQGDNENKHELTLWVKDLGPQMNWRTVFILEYLGPLLIHPLMFYYFYLQKEASASTDLSLQQTLLSKQTVLLIMVVGHYIKRELETIFLHRFSLNTMPLFNLYKNCFHYWILGGVNLAYSLYSPSDSALNLFSAVGILIYLFGEAWNLDTHIVLRKLRQGSSSTTRELPSGHGFDFVTCPNYLAEVFSWVGVWVVSDASIAALIFIIFSALQMLAWARKKEKRYRKEFGERYKWKKYSMIPGLQ